MVEWRRRAVRIVELYRCGGACCLYMLDYRGNLVRRQVKRPLRKWDFDARTPQVRLDLIVEVALEPVLLRRILAPDQQLERERAVAEAEQVHLRMGIWQHASV